MMPLDFDIQGMIEKPQLTETASWQQCLWTLMSRVIADQKTTMPLDLASRAKIEVSAHSDCQLAMMPLDFDVQSYH